MVSTQTVLVVSSSLFTGMISLTMMFLVIWQAPQQRTNQLLALMLASLSGFGFLNALARFIDPFNLDAQIIFSATSGLYTFSIVLLYFFSEEFTESRNLHFRLMAFGFLVLFVVGVMTNQIFGEFKALSSDSGGYVANYKPLGLVLVTAGAIYTFVLTLRMRSNPDPRPQVIWKASGAIFFGVLMLMLRPFTNIVPEPLGFLLTLPYNSIALGAAALILGQAILHYQLFNPLHQLNSELKLANEQLAAANRAKDEFLATMSHELRTPFSGIIGFTQLMKDGMYGEVTAEQDKRLERVLVNAHHVLALINDILDLSKINAGQLEIMRETLPAEPLVNEAMEIVRESARQKGLTLNCEVAQGLKISADERYIRQILLNLLNNAIKFTPQGRVTLRAFQMNDHVCFSVEDTGIGISPEDMPKVFAEFQQVDGSYQRQYGGTGLGMAISQKLAQLHGGSIEITSEVGKGSTFFLWLPNEL